MKRRVDESPIDGPVRATRRSRLRTLLGAVLGTALAVGLAVPSPAAAADRTPTLSKTDGIRAQLPPRPLATKGALLAPRADGIDCVAHTITCGETVTSDITTQDCQYTDGTYFDAYYFDGLAGQTITATLTSPDFDPFLYLYSPDPTVFYMDDDSGPGNAARIVHTLDQTSQDWALAPTPFDPFVTGSYTLSMECEGGGGFFTDPQYPDFRFKVTITPPGGSPIDGIHLSACQEDTVCVAGAIPDRPELYLRILGPRPNGYLWPTLVRFTPSAVTVEIEQISTGAMQTYTLDAIGPGDDNLSGLQDRMGFLP